MTPKLLWVIRDSKIEFIDERENPITENQYFELKLSQKAGSQFRKVQKTREAILNYFPERELVAMGHPLGDDQEGQAL